MKESISFPVFKERTGLEIPICNGADKIAPFRSMVRILSLQVMPVSYMEGLIRSATLEGDPSVHPYANARIRRVRCDPRSLLVGQTFAQREKIQALTENLTGLFGDFCTPSGYAKLSPFIALGQLESGEHAISHYLPPIIEVHNSYYCLIDGIHRNAIVRAAGTTMESLVIEGVGCPPPCDFGPWDGIRFVDQKPPRHERFINLRPDFFRNLGWSGIDG